MLEFFNLQPEIFGMDLNDSSLKIAKLKKRRKGFVLESFNEVTIAPGVIKGGLIQNKEALTQVIQQACKKVIGKKLGTKHVIASLPEEKSFSQIIQMPKMTIEELKLAVPFEAENYIPLTIDNVYLDFETINPIKNDENHLHVLINVMPKSIIDSYVDCFKKAGLIPHILEVESQSIARALIKNGQVESPLVIIDLGISNTSLIIFFGGFIRFTASIPISSSQLTQAISDSLGVSVTDAEELKVKHGLNKKGEQKYNIESAINPILSELVLQIKKYINFFYGHIPHEHSLSDIKIERIILCGGGANLKKLPAFLYKELKIPVELGNPFINIIRQKPGRADTLPYSKILSFTTVLGLALRGANEEM